MNKFEKNTLYKKELRELGYEKDTWNLLIELRDKCFKKEHKEYLEELKNRLKEEKNKDKPSAIRIRKLEKAINENYDYAIRSLEDENSRKIRKILDNMYFSFGNVTVENEALELALEIIKGE